jgi:mono/diheme cytochrome c family protein
LVSRSFLLVAGIALAGFVLQPIAAPQRGASQPAAASAAPAAPAAVLNTYCLSCHSDKGRIGGLSLEGSDLTNVAKGAETWEKVIRKVRAGMMPPPGMPRPDKATLDGFAAFFEGHLDRAAKAKPKPGRLAMHRLNRTEYANAIRDLLALEVDAAALLPPDDESSGFDNIADVLKMSPSLMERYLSASWNISRLAMGNPDIGASTHTYRLRPDLSQDQHIAGMPLGTRGGILAKHTFPVDGEYVIKLRMWRNTFDLMRGMEDSHDIEIAMDGVRLRLVTVGGKDDFAKMAENPGTFGLDLDSRLTVRIPVKAGTHTLTAATVLKSQAKRDDLIKPFLRTTVDGLDIMGDPSVDRLTVEGPFGQVGSGDTASRRKILICKPASAAAEQACATKILSSLARLAYRKRVEPASLSTLMDFYKQGRGKGDFEDGIESALQFVLASPEFLFRFVEDPPNVAANTVYRINDHALASRLSFFLWSSIPDDQLLTLADQGKLKDPAVLEQQVKRMLADKRSEAMIANFVEQWLHLRNLKNSSPNLDAFPDFDDNLRRAMREETTLFFDSVMREDRSVIDLLNADYTFVNERLARHYGIPGIYGSQFRRIKVPSESRRGILGQASILTVTSYPNRTSPVERGKWVLTNLLGVPPQPPPPDVPPLQESAVDKPQSLRERLEQHRKDPVCAGCHKAMDPIGFSLENFDGTGQWRTTDDGRSINAKDTLFNGAAIEGVNGLRREIVKDPGVFIGVMTEKMLTYALGRGAEYYDMPAVRKIVQDAGKTNYKFSSIVLGVVNSAPFQFKEAK